MLRARTGSQLVAWLAVAGVVALGACDRDAGREAPANPHELNQAKCKAGTVSACEELGKLCTAGDAAACAAHEAAKPGPRPTGSGDDAVAPGPAPASSE